MNFNNGVLYMKNLYIKIALHFRQSDQWFWLFSKIAYKVLYVVIIMYFLNMRSISVEIRNICALLFLSFLPFLSCGGYYVRKKRYKSILFASIWRIESELVFKDHDLCTSGVWRCKDLCDPSYGIWGITFGLSFLPLYLCYLFIPVSISY